MTYAVIATLIACTTIISTYLHNIHTELKHTRADLNHDLATLLAALTDLNQTPRHPEAPTRTHRTTRR